MRIGDGDCGAYQLNRLIPAPSLDRSVVAIVVVLAIVLVQFYHYYQVLSDVD